MGLEHRPYVGSWRLNGTKVVQHAPDCLVKFNGETSLPGCTSCNGTIDLQKYILQVGVESGVETGSASANISLSIPIHTAEGMGRDGQYLLRVGLEVNIFMRGYFPVQGQYTDFNTEEDVGGLDISDITNYPYYPVFHGVVTNVDVSKQGGLQSFSVQCNSMLHFWQYHNISQNASVVGNRPENSNMHTNVVGHQYTGWTPYAIVYALFHDVAGAAGGANIGWAVKEVSNFSANSSVGDNSLFSLNLEYWKRRFNSRMIRLRMHGATGKLFNTAQASFMGRLSSNEVNRVLKHFRAKTAKGKHLTPNIYAGAYHLGLYKTTTQPGTGKTVLTPTLDLNIIGSTAADEELKKNSTGEIIASQLEPYAQKDSELGGFNMFESTYQSKLDVATQVSQSAGFEFYQDVDGDVVYKPPLYNLDTSSSRVYRIEEIDVISIAEHDKEPVATYMTFSGGHIRNFSIGGLEGEWGTKGQYADYRLIAQFGWRPESFESTYHNNPRQMFYAAMNRMDVLNAGIRSAEISIPLRPELRPGFPVYVVGIDTFYYLQNMSHSWSFGGACTTSLNLVAGRPKFYAPGHPGKRGIGSIDLSQTSLPRKALKVVDEEGHPRLSGFPNVVLALDPKGVNPLHYISGTDMSDISNPLVLRNLIKSAIDHGIISVNYNAGGTDEDGPYHIVIDNETDLPIDPKGDEAQTALAGASSDGDATKGTIRLDFETFVAGANLITALRAQNSTAAKSFDKLIQEVTGTIQNLTHKRERTLAKGGDSAALSAALEALDSRIAAKINQLKELKTRVTASETALQTKYTNNSEVKTILDVLSTRSNNYMDGLEDYPKASSTAAFLDLLSDKKAAFTSSEIPGSYQYFSCSHPYAEFQAPRVLKPDGVGPEAGDRERVSEKEFVDGYLRFPTKRGADGILPEAELGKIEVTHGFRLLSSAKPDKEDPLKSYRVLPSSKIKNLVLARHELHKTVLQSGYKFGEHFTGLGEKAYTLVAAYIESKSKKNEETLEKIYKPAWDSFLQKGETRYAGFSSSLDFFITDANEDFVLDSEGNRVMGSTLTFPVTINFQGSEYNTAETTLADIKENPPFSVSTPPEQILNLLHFTFTALLYQTTTDTLRAVWIQLQEQLLADQLNSLRTDVVDASKNLEVAFQKLGKVFFGKDFAFRKGAEETQEGTLKKTYASPIFPVSDGNGYMVVGSYQYGRDIDTSPNSSYEQLALADPLSFANPADVEEFVNSLQHDASIYEDSDQVPGLVSPLSRAVNKSGLKLLESIINNPGAPDEVIRLAKGFRSQKDGNNNVVGFSNWIASTFDETVKIPLGNAAFRLADMHIHVDNKSICNCRAAEADLLLENAFDLGQFSQIVDTEDMDQVTAADIRLRQQKAVGWNRTQKALRGEIEPRLDPNYYENRQAAIGGAFGDLDSAVKTAGEDLNTLRERAANEWDRLEDLGDETDTGEEF